MRPPKKDLTPEEAKRLKEERRKLQEAQRLAKGQRPQGGTERDASVHRKASSASASATASASASHGAGPSNTTTTTLADGSIHRKPSSNAAGAGGPGASAATTKVVVSRTEAQKKVPLFLHLKQVEREGSLTKRVSFVPHAREDALGIHPSVVALGLRYAEGVIRGADARAVAMLLAFADVVRDFATPPGEAFARALTKRLNAQFDFLTSCRPHSITMGNAFVHVKQAVSRVAVDLPEDEAKRVVLGVLDEFARTNVMAASDETAAAGAKHICDGDIILTYARSSVVEKAILLAHAEERKSFRVIVIGSRPSKEGVELLKRLAQAGVRCTFGPLASLSYILQGSVTKVFLGAGALLSNGAVLARAGTAMVASMAHVQRIPVMVLAESYKFSERVHLDSVVYNELGDPEDLLLPDSYDGDVAFKDPLADWRDQPSLKLLNLTYDVTQAEYVDMIVTELGNLPPSSVPVIIRERKDLRNAGS